MMMTLQNSLAEMPSSDARIAAINAYLKERGQKVINPETNKEMWIWTKSRLDGCRNAFKERMFNNREFAATGYMAVNDPGRAGWKLLPVACHLEDYPLIDFLLDQGANRTLGCDDCDIRQAADEMGWDKDVIERALQYIAQKPALPSFDWVSRL